MKNKIIGLFFCTLLITTCALPNINGTTSQKNVMSHLRGNLPTPMFDIDWWAMYGHDQNHSRYSTSTAPVTCRLLWTYLAGDWVYSSPAVVDEKVYVGSYDGKLYCLDALSGGLLWSYTTGDSITSSPAVVDGNVYVGSYDNNVYCLDASSGELIWNYTAGDAFVSSPTVVDGKVYIGSHDDNVYCLDASSGELVWSYTAGDWVHSSPAVANGNVYIGSHDRKVHCLDASSGDFIWSYDTGGNVSSSPAVAYDKVYVGSNSDKLSCLDASSGELVWSYTAGDWVLSSPAVAYGNVYTGSWDDKVYCLNASSGELVWNSSTSDPIISSPAVANRNVYIGSCDGRVYCFDAFTGNPIWSYGTSSWVDSTPAIANGNVYIGSMDRKVYAFGTQQNPPVFGTPSPVSGSMGQPTSLSWSIPIKDLEGDFFTWTIQCSNGQTSGASHASNGTKTLSLSDLSYGTTYTVWVNATDPDGSGLYTRRWYTFTTKINLPPAHGIPNPSNGSTNNNLILVWSIPMGDPEGDSFDWTIQCSNGQTSGENHASNGTKMLTLNDLSYGTTFTVWVNATDPGGSSRYTKHWYIFTTQVNQPPLAPMIHGPPHGKVGQLYTYTFNSTDPDTDTVYYYIDWGDNGTSGWIGPYASGTIVPQSHTWMNKETYLIKAKAKDIHGNESNWSTLQVKMPFSYELPHLRFFDWLFDRFPHAFPILRHLMGY